MSFMLIAKYDGECLEINLIYECRAFAILAQELVAWIFKIIIKNQI